MAKKFILRKGVVSWTNFHRRIPRRCRIIKSAHLRPHLIILFRRARRPYIQPFSNRHIQQGTFNKARSIRHIQPFSERPARKAFLQDSRPFPIANMDEYTAEEFVESVAGVVFRLSTKGVCIVYAPLQKEYLLAKGRRWSGETRERAILRIVSEETGYPCRLPAVNMLSRALPPPGTLPGVNEEPPDLVRELRETREPFAMQQIRSLSSSSNEVKLTFVSRHLRGNDTFVSRGQKDTSGSRLFYYFTSAWISLISSFNFLSR